MSFPSIPQQHILITGGAGFIGSNLAEILLSQGKEVTVLDNFSTGKRENLQPFLHHPLFHLIEGDIRSKADCQQALRNTDIVFHEAALGSVPRSVEDPVESAAVNIGGFLQLCHAAAGMETKPQIVYATSSSVYGDIPDSLKTEERTGTPLSPYAVTKKADELFADNFHRIYGLDFIGLRYFNVFGKHQDPDSQYAAVIPRFAKAFLKNRAPVIHGDGSHSRDFTHVSNVILANLLSAAAPPAAWNQIYNVGCSKEITLTELAETLQRSLREILPDLSPLPPVHGPERPGDIPHSCANITKAESMLGYHPCCLFAEGIRLTARWYTENL